MLFEGKLLACLLLMFSAIGAFAQIDMNDSTVQAIGYWDRNETYSYLVTSTKYKVTKDDTTARETLKYDLDITIKDSTANSYTIEWAYKNLQHSSTNELVRKLAAVSENIRVVIKTNEMGAFEEVVNWQEVGTAIRKAVDMLKKEFKAVPKLDEILSPLVATYTTKAGIENTAMLDAQQYYTFHGGKYKLGEEVSAKIQLPNNYGGAPIDADLTVRLDEINPDDNNYIVRYWQEADSKQLTDASYEFIKKIAASAGAKNIPPRDKMPATTHEEDVASRIHGSGWVIYSVRTKVINIEGVSSVDEMIIELK
jgi:hypothetical protein